MGKTIKQIADEIGVTKQAVFKKIRRQPLSDELTGLVTTVGGKMMVSVDGEVLIKKAFEQKCVDEGSQLSTVNHSVAVDKVVGLVDDIDADASDKNHKRSLPEIESDQVSDSRDQGEIVFLRKQIEQMNDQLTRRDAMIDSLNKELEKEREHNREKDKKLLETLTKLADTQAALAVGQSAEKQKALAEMLIEGQQMIEEEPAVYTDLAVNDLEEELGEESKKGDWMQRLWRFFRK